MSSLSDYIRGKFLPLARSQPGKASDPDVLRALEREANLRSDHFAAQVYPIAPFAWNVQQLIVQGNGQNPTPRQAFDLPFRAEIVAIHSTVCRAGTSATGTADAARADIQCAIDLSFSEYLTSAKGTNPNGNVVDGNFVTLESFDLVNSPRIVSYTPEGAIPQIGFAFRWAAVPGVAPGRDFRDTFVQMTLYARRVPNGQ